VAESYVCCFCGQGIEQTDVDAVELIATNLWDRDGAQAVYAHSVCAEQQMAAGQLMPSVLHGTDNNYTLQEVVWGEHRANRVPRWTCLVVIMALAAVAYFVLR
jgi:hypothetical protein